MGRSHNLAGMKNVDNFLLKILHDMSLGAACMSSASERGHKSFQGCQRPLGNSHLWTHSDYSEGRADDSSYGWKNVLYERIG